MTTLQVPPAAPPLAPLAPAVGARRRQTIAALFGERQFEGIDWRRLMQDGVLVRVHIAGSSLFWSQLTYDDLGIRVEHTEQRQQLSKWMTLGKKRLLPEEYMKSLSLIESRARYALKERSFRTELGAFVPSTAYVPWRETTQNLRDQYLALRDTILANHTQLAREVLGEYEDIASQTYQRLTQAHPDLLTESRAQFVRTYCERIAAHIPTPDRIREKFDFTSVLVDGLSQVGETQAEQRGESVEGLPSSIEEARGAVGQREWQRSVLQHDLRAHAQARVNAVLEDFLGSVASQLRTLTYEAACDVLATLERRSNESISPRSILQLTNLLSQVRSLNFWQDGDLERMMSHLEQIVAQTPAERQRSLADIRQTLHAIAVTTRATLLDLGEEPRSARAVGVSDFPTEAAVRGARAEIGLDLALGQFATLVQTRAEVRASRAEERATGMESLWAFVGQEPVRGPRQA